MLIRITPKNSTHAVVASTRDKTTLEGLETLCNLYEHMLHLQENQGYVYDNLDTIVEAAWDYVGCHEGTTQRWEVSHDPSIIWDLAAVNSRGVAALMQVSSIRIRAIKSTSPRLYSRRAGCSMKIFISTDLQRTKMGTGKS